MDEGCFVKHTKQMLSSALLRSLNAPRSADFRFTMSKLFRVGDCHEFTLQFQRELFCGPIKFLRIAASNS